MATTAGAKALGLGTGELRAGAPADLVLVSTRIPCNTPLHNATQISSIPVMVHRLKRPYAMDVF